MSRGIDVRYVTGTPIQAFTNTLVGMMFIIIMLVMCATILRTVMFNSAIKAEKAQGVPVTFKDVRGMSETKEEVRFAVEQLRNRGTLKAMEQDLCEAFYWKPTYP